MPDGYAHREVLVDTVWLGDHLQDPTVRVAEVSEDVTLYARGHIPGAVHFNWQTQLQDRVRRDWINKEQFEHLLGACGVDNATTLVLYGDKHNWFATYSLWLCRMYGVQRVHILNGGRAKWMAEGRPMAADVSSYPVSLSGRKIRTSASAHFAIRCWHGSETPAWPSWMSGRRKSTAAR